MCRISNAHRIIAVFFTLGAAFSTHAGELTTVPRYRLEPGKQIIFRSMSIGNYTKQTHISDTVLSVTVLKALPPDAWDILCHETSTFRQIYSDPEMQKYSSPGEPDYNFGRYTVHADGNIDRSTAMNDFHSPAAFFPLLPPSLGTTEWDRPQPMAGGKTVYHLSKESSGPQEILIAADQQGPHNEIYLSTFQEWIHFDLKRGLPVKKESTYSQNYGFKGSGTGATSITSERKLAPDELTALIADSDAYFVGQKRYSDELDKLDKSEDVDATATLATAKTALKDIASGIRTPEFKTQLERDLRSFDQSEKYMADRASRKSNVLNKPSPEWSAADMEGTTHTLASYRGKVLLLDFWYRGCGWCITAMPKIKEIASRYAGQPVVVLGMNTDEDPDDIRFVEQKMKLNYPTLRAKEIPSKYEVRGFPTLLLIDKKGVVRHVHVGFSPDMVEELRKKIDSLLAE